VAVVVNGPGVNNSIAYELYSSIVSKIYIVWARF